MIDWTKREQRTVDGNQAIVNRIIHTDEEGDVSYRGYVWDDFGQREDGTKIPGPMVACWWVEDGRPVDPWIRRFELEGGQE